MLAKKALLSRSTGLCKHCMLQPFSSKAGDNERPTPLHRQTRNFSSGTAGPPRSPPPAAAPGTDYLSLFQPATTCGGGLATFSPASTENLATLCLCRQWDSGRLRYGLMYRDARQFCSKNETDDSENDAGELPSRDALENSDNEEIPDDEDSDGMYSDQDVLKAFQSELAADDDKDDEEWGAEASERATQADHKSKKVQPDDDEHEWRPGKPWNTKERTKACLNRLTKGPDGRYMNVLEVATEVDMLLASFLKLRKEDDPDHADNSDDDEKYLEGVDIKKFKRLQKQLRDGTYKFQPIVELPLGKRKIVKLKKKEVKKRHPF